MAAVIMTGTGIYSANGNANTQSVNLGTIGNIGDSTVSFTTGSGSVTRKFSLLDTTFAGISNPPADGAFDRESYLNQRYDQGPFESKEKGYFETSFSVSQQPEAQTVTVNGFIFALPSPSQQYEIGSWNFYVIGAYYESTINTNVLTSFQYQRIRLNYDTVQNLSTNVSTTNIRGAILRNEEYTNAGVNFPTSKVAITPGGGFGLQFTLSSRSNNVAGSRTIWRVYAQNNWV